MPVNESTFFNLGPLCWGKFDFTFFVYSPKCRWHLSADNELLKTHTTLLKANLIRQLLVETEEYDTIENDTFNGARILIFCQLTFEVSLKFNNKGKFTFAIAFLLVCFFQSAPTVF